MASEFADLVIQWNNEWRYDYWYREKNNIAFNSSQHRELCQIDIKFMFCEQKLVADEKLKRKIEKRKLELFEKTGKYLIPRVDENQEDDLFEQIDITDQ